MRPIKTLCLMIMAALLISSDNPATAQSKRPVALPVDEAAENASFLAFRSQLELYVKNHDIDGIIASSCPDINLSFGSSSGHAYLRDYLTVPEDGFSDEYKHHADKIRARNWANLQKTLALGGRFDADGNFWAPYTWLADIADHYDGYTTYFVIGTNVLVRDKPSKDAVAIDSLSHNIVTVPWLGAEQNGEDAVYLPVEQPDGTIGYVHRDYLRSQIDYRARFERNEDGQWKMCMFLAGD